MNVIRSLEEIRPDPRSVVTVGTFDGVHLAHQEIVRDVVNRAKLNEGRSVVITFEPHPKEVVGASGSQVRLLSTVEERTELLARLNVDILYIIHFTWEFSRLTSREFYQRYVVDGIGVSEVVVGYDHTFGRDREAGIEELVKMGQEYNFSVSAVHPFRVEGEVVSSTEIRNALLAGNLPRAEQFLGHRYGVSGRVIPGDGRGRTIGYPTANIKPLSEKKIVPARGVYVVGVTCRGKEYVGMMNIGVRPTVTEGTAQTMEVHIFNMDENIYGERVGVTFLQRLRDERKFSSVQELVAQLDRDKAESLRCIAGLTGTAQVGNGKRQFNII